jgi:hypothetical protein
MQAAKPERECPIEVVPAKDLSRGPSMPDTLDHSRTLRIARQLKRRR